MAVTSHTILRESVQADGSVRGHVEYTLDDARTVMRRVRGADKAAFDAQVLALIDDVQAQVEREDAQAAVQAEQGVVDNGQATANKTALEYLRHAFNQSSPKAARAAFLVADAYRESQGWTLDDAKANALAEGMSEDEWDRIGAAYLWLMDADNAALLDAHETVAAFWEVR